MLPDFLCIGSQKAGTTWLHRNLDVHPGIDLPPEKEIHYFDRLFPVPLRAPKRRPRPDPAWYESRFRPRPGCITGDITPAYGALSGAAVRHVRVTVPDAKILLLMRDPVERAWSHACMYLTNNLSLPLHELDDSEFLEHFDHPACRTRGDYLRTLDIWSAHFPADRFFVAFFDDLADRPAALLGEIHRFLGVESSPRHIPETVQRKVFSGNSGEVPARFGDYLSRQLLDSIREIHLRFGGHATKWYRRALRRMDTESIPYEPPRERVGPIDREASTGP